MGTLFLVATPIGNLEDITQRALDILAKVQLIAAEDTRQTRVLLQHYSIQTKTTSYHEHNKKTKTVEILAALEAGDVALVSDAGTPAINDPGYELVRAAIEARFNVSPIPGPSAPISALIASGLPTDKFLYLGYLPRKASERRQLLSEVSELTYTLIILETPHRIMAAFDDLLELLGDREICVAREITKLYEEFFRGTIHSAQEHYAATPPRGEITLVVSGKIQTQSAWAEADIRTALIETLGQDSSASQLAGKIAKQSGWSKREVYKILLDIQSRST